MFTKSLSAAKTALKTKAESGFFEALMPFSIALAMLVFVIFPHTTHAAQTYYVDLPTGQTCHSGGQGGYSTCGSSAYGANPCGTCGGYTYPTYGQSYGYPAYTQPCSYGTTCGNTYGSGYGPYGSAQYNNANNYPYYTYQYYTNPNPYGVGTNNYGNNNGYTTYTPTTANFTPYPYPEYVQYVRQADGTYRLGSPKQIPTYAWNADNSIPSSAYGTYGNGYGTTPYYGNYGTAPYGGTYGTYPYYR